MALEIDLQRTIEGELKGPICVSPTASQTHVLSAFFVPHQIL